jgi:hypothetical protein
MVSRGHAASTPFGHQTPYPPVTASPASLILAHGIIPDLLEFDMRYVRRLVGGNDGVAF